ncbi:MAG: R3H domain-containing nucleic acid-binding protein [Holophagaceae bacterium]
MARRAVPLDQIPALAQGWCAKLGLHVETRFEASGDEELFPHRMVVDGPDASWLAASKGQALDALQYLLHEAQGERDENRVVYLDASGARLFRMKELKAMVGLAAQTARERGSYTFGPMSPRERRWIHLLIAREAGLASESEGTGHFKAVKVSRQA